jgi:hypothetical protein
MMLVMRSDGRAKNQQEAHTVNLLNTEQSAGTVVVANVIFAGQPMQKRSCKQEKHERLLLS